MEKKTSTQRRIEKIAVYLVLGLIVHGLADLTDSTFLELFYTSWLIPFELIFCLSVGLLTAQAQSSINRLVKLKPGIRSYIESSVSEAKTTLTETYLTVIIAVFCGVMFSAVTVEVTFKDWPKYSGYILTIIVLYQLEIVRDLSKGIFIASKAEFDLSESHESQPK